MVRIRSLCVGSFVLLGALALAGCGGGGGGGSTPTDPKPPGGGTGNTVHIVQIKDNSYEPKSLTIEPGDTVRWVMSGSAKNHTVTATDGSFDSGAVFTGANAVYERKFDQTGKTIEYSCTAHSACCLMRGSIRVGSNSPPPDPTYE
jgi:plastocyanin